jgi:serine/threonine-protein kinase
MTAEPLALVDRLPVIPWLRRMFRAKTPAPPPQWATATHSSDVEIPLLPSFRFAHEPVEMSSRPGHFIGRDADLDVLVQRILFSDGGSFLVTGYRGVGKTSFVNQVIHRMRAIAPLVEGEVGEIEIIDVSITLARTVTGADLMHHIIRRLYDRLAEKGGLKHLDVAIRSELVLAYQRTSMNVTRKSVEGREKQFGVNEAGMTAALLGAFKLSWLQKLTFSKAEEMTFLGYDDRAAENDLIRIARQLTAPPVPRKLGRTEPRLKIVLVFDEIDKMDDSGGQASVPPVRPLDDILGSLKNLFTTSGISFLFIAGKDLQERWIEDLGRGDSIYESVFCFDKYLPCLWEEVGAICHCFVDEKKLAALAAPVRAALGYFEQYLHYKGRGIPRRIIREFNHFVRWTAREPRLAFSQQDVRRFRFYAELQTLLSARWQENRAAGTDDASTTRNDKERLGTLYLIDWILGRGKQEFTADDAVAASHALSAKIAPAKEIAPAVIGEMLSFLVLHEYLEEVRRGLGATVIQPVQKEKRYRLAARRLAEMGNDPLAPEVPNMTRTGIVIGGSAARFLNMEMIGSGGMGSVYRAWDSRHGRFVAVKMIARSLAQDEAVRARFEREANIVASFQHPNIVRLFEYISSDDLGSPAMVMEFISGIALSELLHAAGPLSWELAVGIGRKIADALAYVHRRDVVRNDLKPSNILISDEARVVMIDFGISKQVGGSVSQQGAASLTAAGMFIGTPNYASPEQIAGRPLDNRSDIYSLGVVLFELITGRLPFAHIDDVRALMLAVMSSEAPRVTELASVPPQLDELVAACLRKDPQQRPSNVDEVLEALARVDMMGDTTFAEELARSVQRAVGHRQRQQQPTLSASEAPAEMIAPAIRWPRRRPADGGARLVVRQPDFDNELEVEVGSHLRIGRSADADLHIGSPVVSRLHAEILRREGRYVIRDLNSANGTYVNGDRIVIELALVDGSEITIGDVRLIFMSAEDNRGR